MITRVYPGLLTSQYDSIFLYFYSRGEFDTLIQMISYRILYNDFKSSSVGANIVANEIVIAQ